MVHAFFGYKLYLIWVTGQKIYNI